MSDFDRVVPFNEVCEYLLDELEEEYSLMLQNKENRFSYIFRICNDLGVSVPFLKKHNMWKEI